ncbi:hypothetical protein [Rhabdochromatium marinum]|uniref:hypothetical protein n=1 Tax=Rhabdochromatium marinum TaxID=48729 RepID=UPI0019042975|nr:hypothetical protein [Rhabdochromatium marinum]MBK1648564.1 hypothetical protein [Rhabdochromatium marinum]
MKTSRVIAYCSILAGLPIAQGASADVGPLVAGTYSLESAETSSTLTIEFKHGQGALLSAEAILLNASGHYGAIDQARLELPHQHEGYLGIYHGYGCTIELSGTPMGLHAEQQGRCEDFGMGVELTGDYIRTTSHYDDIQRGEVTTPEPDKPGLFVAGFRVTYFPPRGRASVPQNYSYRIYCPTRMVRNIGNGRWDDARKAEAEDERRFSGQYVVRAVVADVCDHDI